MTRTSRLPEDVCAALAVTIRSPGWNSRQPDVRRFELGECTLYVVPFRRWAYRRREERAAAWWSGRDGEAEPA